MRLRRILLMIVVLTGLSSGLWAQDTLKLSVQKAVDLALSDNPTIKIADKEIERQLYVRRETQGHLLPSVSVNGSYTRAIKKMEYDLGGGQKMSFDADNSIVGVANLTLPLFAPTVYSMLKMNGEQMKVAVEQARASKIDLTYQVRTTCYNIMLAHQSLKVLLASEQNIKQYCDQTRSMFQQGLASEYDLITAEVQLSNLKPTIIQTRNAIKVTEMLLKMYLYLPENVNVSIEGELADFQNMIANDHQKGFDRDFSNNTDLKLLELQENILNYQWKMSRAQRMPTLAAVANYQVMGRTPSAGFGGAAPVSDKTFTWMHPLSAGVQLSIPIFSGLSKSNNQKQVKNSIEQLKLQREYMVQSINVQVNTAINNVITAREQMMANQKTVAQAKKGYEITKTRYLSGTGTILELNNAELSMTQAQLNYSQSIFDYLSADANYRKITGQEK